MSNSKALTLPSMLGRTNSSSITLGDINTYTIQGWQQSFEKERYAQKPFRDNYRLLEIAETKDPEGIPAKIKEFLDGIEKNDPNFQPIDLATIYNKFLKDKNDDEVDWEAFEQEVRQYEAILQMFSDQKEREVGVISFANERTVSSARERLEALFEANVEYFSIQTGGIVLYIKSITPDIYGTNHSLDIRYFVGDKLRRVTIRLQKTAIDRSILKADTFDLRSTTAIEVENLQGGNYRSWVEGTLPEAIDKFENEVNTTRASLESQEGRLERLYKPGTSGYENAKLRLTVRKQALTRAETQLISLRTENALIEEPKGYSV